MVEAYSWKTNRKHMVKYEKYAKIKNGICKYQNI